MWHECRVIIDCKWKFYDLHSRRNGPVWLQHAQCMLTLCKAVVHLNVCVDTQLMEWRASSGNCCFHFSSLFCVFPFSSKRVWFFPSFISIPGYTEISRKQMPAVNCRVAASEWRSSPAILIVMMVTFLTAHPLLLLLLIRGQSKPSLKVYGNRKLYYLNFKVLSNWSGSLVLGFYHLLSAVQDLCFV